MNLKIYRKYFFLLYYLKKPLSIVQKVHLNNWIGQSKKPSFSGKYKNDNCLWSSKEFQSIRDLPLIQIRHLKTSLSNWIYYRRQWINSFSKTVIFSLKFCFANSLFISWSNPPIRDTGFRKKKRKIKYFLFFFCWKQTLIKFW